MQRPDYGEFSSRDSFVNYRHVRLRRERGRHDEFGSIQIRYDLDVGLLGEEGEQPRSYQGDTLCDQRTDHN
jgi:hypothetical protein